jgi:probable HAF family extracellular repeat protein
MQRPTAIFRLKLATVLAGSALLLDVANAATPQFNAVDIGSLGGSSGADIDSKQSWWYGTTASAYTIANGINNSGQVVGVSVTTMFDAYGLPVHHAFLYSGATMTDLGTLIGPTNNSVANAINDIGQVVGGSDANYINMDGDPVITFEPFLYCGNAMTGLAFPQVCAVPGGSASGININGQIVGTVYNSCTVYAFLYSGATFSYFR